MALSEFAQGTVICGEGEKLTNLFLIMKGSVEASFNNHVFRLEKGDVIGLCDLNSGSHSRTYTAASDIAAIGYTCDDDGVFTKLMCDNADAADLLVNSMCRQTAELLLYHTSLKNEAGSAYKLIEETYPQYVQMCKQYAFTPKKIPELESAAAFSGSVKIEDWVAQYYMGVKGLEPAARRGFFHGNPGIELGFLRMSAADATRVLQACKEYQDYLKGMSELFVGESEHDLLSLVAELHYNSINMKGADDAVTGLMSQLTDVLYFMTGINQDRYQERLFTYMQTLNEKRAGAEVTDAPVDSSVMQNLSGSMSVILEYSGCPEETCSKFTRYVQDYSALPDRGGADDVSRRIRKELTALFYELYTNVFIKSLQDSSLPTIIKMFLNFGYVDAALAGVENADYLYSVADSLKGDPSSGIYTAREWLTAVFKGLKEPNRNEFDMDYAEHLKELKNQGKIDANEETRLLKDPENKLRFELDNVFQTVNKITFGRISIYCPLFSEHTVQRSLGMSMVAPAALKECFDDIRRVDFSAYYRGILFSDDKAGIANETINVEVLPNVILMPNVGVRGVMWQEIEGRKRQTAARIFLPMFLEPDLKGLIIKITGEFRWEMCKRIQGMRWNDVTNPSLTSEYCDYLQFYKNNRELSSEVKDSIKQELMRAKNNYKMVFVANYSDWLAYEANGAPRLNKFTLGMMMTYCPFSADIREKLTQHPRYAGLLTKYNIKHQQAIQRMSNVIQKANREAGKVPEELQNEMEFLKS